MERGKFQKNLVVWKLICMFSNEDVSMEFQKNLVVWKRRKIGLSTPFCSYVSEELSSVETQSIILNMKMV